MASSRPSDLIRSAIVRRVRAVFNDLDNGERPVPVSDEALFERDSPIRLVHADVVAMMIGGMSALLLQALHPHALKGVLDHSDFRTDMHGRLRRTARFIAVTTFGHRDDAQAAIARVNRIHSGVKGALDDGTPYSARDPATLAWVHLTEAISFLAAYSRFVRPLPVAAQDEYFRQFARVARRLGADPAPESVGDAQALIAAYRAELVGSPEARAIARLVLDPRPGSAPAAVQRALANEAVALLPPFARTMLGLNRNRLGALPGRIAIRGAGATLRWAFRQR